MALPDEIEKRVVARLYQDADHLDWAHLSVTARSAQYAKWIQDPEVGDVLTKFMTPEQARVWIKDGPMKEWARAVNGIGKYAPLVARPSATPAELIHKALGTDWQPRDDTQRIKPLRINATHGEDEVTFAWGPEKDLKHLVWAALQAGANGDPVPWVLCVTSTFTTPVPANVRQAHLRIAARCGLRITHVTV
jgi:hypothetical protein